MSTDDSPGRTTYLRWSVCVPPESKHRTTLDDGNGPGAEIDAPPQVCVSYDIAAAFDSVSHHQLVKALPEFGIDQHTRRLIHNCLRNRTFQVKYRAASGDFKGDPASISAGLPQGGVLSPLLWITFFNEIHTSLQGMRAALGLELNRFLD